MASEGDQVSLSGSDPIWFWSRGDRGGEDHGRTSGHAVPLVGCGKQEEGEVHSPWKWLQCLWMKMLFLRPSVWTFARCWLASLRPSPSPWRLGPTSPSPWTPGGRQLPLLQRRRRKPRQPWDAMPGEEKSFCGKNLLHLHQFLKKELKLCRRLRHPCTTIPLHLHLQGGDKWSLSGRGRCLPSFNQLDGANSLPAGGEEIADLVLPHYHGVNMTRMDEGDQSVFACKLCFHLWRTQDEVENCECNHHHDCIPYCLYVNIAKIDSDL